MQAYLLTIVCMFGRNRAVCLREEAICAKVYRRTDGQTDDGRRAIAKGKKVKVKTSIYIARLMQQAPLTRTSLKLGRQTAI